MHTRVPDIYPYISPYIIDTNTYHTPTLKARCSCYSSAVPQTPNSQRLSAARTLDNTPSRRREIERKKRRLQRRSIRRRENRRRFNEQHPVTMLQTLARKKRKVHPSVSRYRKADSSDDTGRHTFTPKRRPTQRDTLRRTTASHRCVRVFCRNKLSSPLNRTHQRAQRPSPRRSRGLLTDAFVEDLDRRSSRNVDCELSPASLTLLLVTTRD